jgi:hypothetical protein
MDRMESQSQSTSRKVELREKIRALEAEKTSLESEITILKERVDVKELEAYTASLENEVGTLRVEKTILEERATLSTPYNAYPVEDVPLQTPISSLETSQAEETTDVAQEDSIVQPISNETTDTVAAS